jgi:hypothetical protein
MAYGIRLRNAAGQEFFNTDSITWNYVGSFIVEANTSWLQVFPILNSLSEVLIQTLFVDVAPGNQEAYVHSVSRLGDTVTASSLGGVGTVRTLVVVLGR